MQVERKVEGLSVCECGGQPDHVTIGYGRTPYNVCCPKCKKQTIVYMAIGGPITNAVKAWNQIAPLQELERTDGQLYEHCGQQLVGEQVRQALLDGSIAEPLYILFKNGKVETDKYTFLRQGIDY